MAMSATIALSPSSALVNQPVACTVTVTNSGANALNVTSIKPFIIPTGAASSSASAPAASFGMAPLGPGETIAVAGSSGTQTFLFYAVFFQPSVTTFDVSCRCQASDGSQFQPTAATVTITGVPNS